MMKRMIWIAAAALLTLPGCQESLEERCLREAQEYTYKYCPVTIDKGVTLDSLTFDAGTHTLCYSYTLTGVIDDSTVIQKNDIRQQMLQNLKNTTSLKLYKSAGYQFKYTYYSGSRHAQKLFEAIFQEKDYR